MASKYEKKVQSLLRCRPDKHLYHREGQELEFKEQFNFSNLAEYLKDFAGFANNRGGIIIFGVKDSPRLRVGLSEKSEKLFDNIDPARLSGELLDSFSGKIDWEHDILSLDGMVFGFMVVRRAEVRPVVTKKDLGSSQELKSGEIYYRYGGRTQKIQYAELENIIAARIKENNKQWIDLVSKIGSAGPENAAILNTEKSLIEKGEAQALMIDDSLIPKIKFVKEGEFVETGGSTALKLVGDVVPVNQIEVVKKVKESLTSRYPLSATELAREVKKRLPDVGVNRIWDTIKENGIKDDTQYSEYNFRNKKQEDEYRQSGQVALGTPSIYNQEAVNFVVKVLGE